MARGAHLGQLVQREDVEMGKTFDVDDAVRRWAEARKNGEVRRAAAIARQVREHGFRDPADILFSQYAAAVAAKASQRA